MTELRIIARGRVMAATGKAQSLRERAGISGPEMAEAVDVDPSTLWRWEKGITRPRADAAQRWAAALGALAEELED